MKHLLTATALAALLFVNGCAQDEGGSVALDSSAPPSAVVPANLVEAQLQNVPLALQPAPTRHLPLISAALTSRSQRLSLQDLQADFETMFYPINPNYGLTASSPHGVQNANFIRSQSEAGNFDITARPIVNNPLNVTGVIFEPIRYPVQLEIGRINETMQLSGCLLLPEGIERSKIKGVVLYYHGAVYNKSNVGSNPANGETQLAAAVLASQGYIVVIPDGIGLGDDWQRVHPFLLYPRASARAGLALVNAVKSRIEQYYQIQPQSPALKLFSMGYSEGAFYALWLAEYLRNHPADLDPRYRLTHTLGLEGIYSLADVTQRYLFDYVGAPPLDDRYKTNTLNVINFSKPLLVASLYLTHGHYALDGNPGTMERLLNQDFFRMQPAPLTFQDYCLVDGKRTNLLYAFLRPATDISLAVGVAASGAGTIRVNPHPIKAGPYYPFLIEYGSSLLNQAKPLTVTDLSSVLALSDFNLANLPDRSISLIHLNRDSVVVPGNFDSLLSRYPSKIRTALQIDGSELVVPSPFDSTAGRPVFTSVDHAEAPIYEFLYALRILNEF